jgi:hypothetical protein
LDDARMDFEKLLNATEDIPEGLDLEYARNLR